MNQLPLLEQLQKVNDPEGVRARLYKGEYHSPSKEIVEHYLYLVEKEKADKAAACAEARADKNLKIVQSADSTAKTALGVAVVSALAAIIAAIAAIVSD